MDGAFAGLRTVNAENDREHVDQARPRLSEDKHETTRTCKRAGGPAGPLSRKEQHVSPRVPLAFLVPGASRVLTVVGCLPSNIDETELARIARRWSR